ncbi:MAG TPA: malto-oligosyltrehalose trehalohydrolase [Thermoanaerobaculia bacterium]|nr:malto-oligosyltrehalose trehalohydrolase [Thermoanaerobaculia bacterium]
MRRRSIGAEAGADGVSFRVWAPAHERVAVVIDGRDFPLEREARGYFSGLVTGAGAGTLYKIRAGDGAYPDPASRFQPDGVHGPSEVIDPQFAWREWRGVQLKDAVIYEMHIGTFTAEGTYAAAVRHLDALAQLGITILELLPLHDFPGRFGWGYDGVDLWAPTRLYGRPEELRRFVDEAHARGLAVILDVVYNHFGPDGCYLRQFTPHYFTDRYENDWGDSVNFDGQEAHGVREFVAENAAYWIDEFHFDGLRADATQSIFDQSEPHILREIRDRAPGLIVAENEPQDTRLLREFGFDAMWNDDWHHAALVAATGRSEAYYTDYRGRAQEFAAMAKLGFLYQGQRYKWQKQRRGTPSYDIAPERLVCYLQNHDQVANSGTGARLGDLTSPGRLRALTALLLLQPQTPMLFQGQEFGARSPFLFFADHEPELAKLVRKGRREFLNQFPSLRGAELDPPDDEATFLKSKLDHTRRDEEIVALHRELLALRRQQPFGARLEGAALSDDCLALRWLGDDQRLLIVNLGRQLDLDPAPEPLLAPPRGFRRWKTVWSSEAMPEPDSEEHWRIAGEAAVLLKPA